MSDQKTMTQKPAPTASAPDVGEIDLGGADPNFQHEVAARPGGENIKKCYACGACSVVCPVEAQNPEFDPRRIIRMVLLGLKKEVLSSPVLWLCSTCYTCLETCPQGVGFTEVLFVLKNMAAEAGYFPPALGAQADLLRDHGRLYEITDFENDKRAALGLPELPERPEHFRLILKDFELEPGGDG